MTGRMCLFRLALQIVHNPTEYVAAVTAEHVHGIPEVQGRTEVCDVPQLTDDPAPSYFIERLTAKLESIW